MALNNSIFLRLVEAVAKRPWCGRNWRRCSGTNKKLSSTILNPPPACRGSSSLVVMRPKEQPFGGNDEQLLANKVDIEKAIGLGAGLSHAQVQSQSPLATKNVLILNS